MKFDQDLCLNLQYDFGKMNSTLGSVVPLAMFFYQKKRFFLVQKDWPFLCILKMQNGYERGGATVNGKCLNFFNSFLDSFPNIKYFPVGGRRGSTHVRGHNFPLELLITYYPRSLPLRQGSYAGDFCYEYHNK